MESDFISSFPRRKKLNMFRFGIENGVQTIDKLARRKMWLVGKTLSAISTTYSVVTTVCGTLNKNSDKE